jgi:hypothetical protein
MERPPPGDAPLSYCPATSPAQYRSSEWRPAFEQMLEGSELSPDVAADHNSPDRTQRLGDLPVDVVNLAEPRSGALWLEFVQHVEYSVRVLLSPSQAVRRLELDHLHGQLDGPYAAVGGVARDISR